MLFNYTDTLQNIIESFPPNHDESLSNAQVIENGRPYVFNFDYPLFDPAYKNVFETHFIRNFYTRQIGFESFGMFKFQLETWLEINMPYYNKLFESELIDYDPLTNTKFDETANRTIDRDQTDNKEHSKTGNTQTDSTVERTQNGHEVTDQSGTTTGESETSNTANAASRGGTTSSAENSSTITNDNFRRNLESKPADGRLEITTNDGEGVIEYASDIKEETDNRSQNENNSGTQTSSENNQVETASKTNDNTNITNTNNQESTTSDNVNTVGNESSTITTNETDDLTSKIKTVDDYVVHRVGKVGTQTYAAMILEYRSTLLRIERQIFEELNQLFMLVY